MALNHPMPDQVPDHDSRPLHMKLREQIAYAIIMGEYGEGEMLPSVRALSRAEGANPLTVAKAYQYFQREGLVEVRRGIGMFVQPGAAQRLRQVERANFLAREWPAIRKKMSILEIAVTDLSEKR